jgi:ABC-type transport system involved in cytochrome c biogenesis permease subunit
MIAAIAFYILAAALLVQIAFFFFNNYNSSVILSISYAAAGLLLITELLRRSLMIGFPAVTGMYEALIFLGGAVLLLNSLYGLQRRMPYFPSVSFGTGLLVFGLLSLLSSPLIPADAEPPVPALQSAWLILHVALSFIGEAFFALGFISSLYHLLVRDGKKKAAADRLTAVAISIGYPFFTLGALIFGAVWAQAAWGRFWGWDPKETWALITWLVYTAYLHARFIAKFKGKITAVLSVAGFLFALFTFLGVNYLLAGLHSYR